MKKQIISAIVLATVLATAQADTNVTVLVPGKPGGSFTTALTYLSTAIADKGMTLTTEYVGSCEKLNSILANTTDKVAYIWASDLTCQMPLPISKRSLVSIVNQSPTYLCGKLNSLAAYKDKQNIKLAVNAGQNNVVRGEQILKGLALSDTRVAAYPNSGAVKTALMTNEVDLMYATNGKQLASEGTVTCYAASSDVPLPNLQSIQSIVGGKVGEDMQRNYIMAHNFSDSEFANFQSTILTQVNSPAYHEFVTTTMKRQAPASTIDAQVKTLTQ